MTDIAEPLGAEIVPLAHDIEQVPPPSGLVHEASALAPVLEMMGLPSPAEFAALRGMSEQLAMSNLVPKPLVGRPADIFLILLTGRDLRIGATMALQRVYVIDGKPSISAELMVALVLRAGYRIWPDPANDATKATVHAIRDGQALAATFTIEDAATAKLTGKGTWQSYPKNMLYARAVSTLCRQSFPDVLTGVTYTPEELDVPVDETGQVIGDPYRPTALLTPEDEAKAAGWLSIADYDAHKAEIVDGVAKLSEDDRAAYKAWMADNGLPPKGWSRAQWEALSVELARRLNPGAEVTTDPIANGPQGAPVVTDEEPFGGETPPLPEPRGPRPVPTIAAEVARLAEEQQARSDEQTISFAQKTGSDIPPEIADRHRQRLERAKASLAAAEATYRTPQNALEPTEAAESPGTASEPPTVTENPLVGEVIERASTWLLQRGEKSLEERRLVELSDAAETMGLATNGTKAALIARVAESICRTLDELESQTGLFDAPAGDGSEPF